MSDTTTTATPNATDEATAAVEAIRGLKRDHEHARANHEEMLEAVEAELNRANGRAGAMMAIRAAASFILEDLFGCVTAFSANDESAPEHRLIALARRRIKASWKRHSDALDVVGQTITHALAVDATDAESDLIELRDQLKRVVDSWSDKRTDESGIPF